MESLFFIVAIGVCYYLVFTRVATTRPHLAPVPVDKVQMPDHVYDEWGCIYCGLTPDDGDIRDCVYSPVNHTLKPAVRPVPPDVLKGIREEVKDARARAAFPTGELTFLMGQPEVYDHHECDAEDEILENWLTSMENRALLRHTLEQARFRVLPVSGSQA
jgi:hypothetical protein